METVSFMFSVEMIAGVLAGLVVAMIVLLILQVRNTSAVDRLSAPAYEYVQNQAKKEANQILKEAEGKATAIINEAEAEREKLLSLYAEHFASLETAQKDKLAELSSKLEHSLTKEFTDTLKQTEQKLSATLDMVGKSEHALSEKVEAVTSSLTNTTKSLNEQLTASAKEIKLSLENLFEKSKQEIQKQEATLNEAMKEQAEIARRAVDTQIETYKASREAIVDAHITQLVEKVAGTVLHKQLTIQEHAELAREALKTAKEKQIL